MQSGWNEKNVLFSAPPTLSESPKPASCVARTLVYATGRERKEDGKPCVTSVTITLFEITFRQTSLSFKQFFCKDQKTLMLSFETRE